LSRSVIYFLGFATFVCVLAFLWYHW
jgi:hypothetical protein